MDPQAGVGHPSGDIAGSLQPGARVGSAYEVIEYVAEGGMGFIYRGRELATGGIVALKLMRSMLRSDESASKRFRREAETVAQIDHPCVVRLYEFGTTDDGLLYIAMEWINGDDLGKVIARHGQLEPGRAARIAAMVARTLAVAHAQGIVHRDLKPENIILLEDADGRDRVKVLDFGIAKAINKPAQTQLTLFGTICGTPEFMSPEQALGKELDGRSDVYALGCVLYNLLVGHEPFQATMPLAIVMKHLNEALPRLPAHLPSALGTIIDRATEKAIEARYPDVSAMAEALEDFETISQLELDVVSTDHAQFDFADAETRVGMHAVFTPPGGTPKLQPPAPAAAPQANAPPAYGTYPSAYGNAPQAMIATPHGGARPTAMMQNPAMMRQAQGIPTNLKILLALLAVLLVVIGVAIALLVAG